MVSFANEYIPANETLSERIEYNGTFSVSSSGSGSGEEHEIKGPVSPVKTPKSPTKPHNLARLKSRTSSSASSAKYFHAGGRTVYTSGRPPWYDCHGLLKEAFVIGKF